MSAPLQVTADRRQATTEAASPARATDPPDAPAPFRVTAWQRLATGDTTRISARLDGYLIWFESTAFGDTPECGDPFLAVALVAAMAQQRPLDLAELPALSPGLVGRLDTIQSLWTQWNSSLHQVAVRADTAAPARRRQGAGCFFSGGISAVHLALDGSSPGDRLVHISGFDSEPVDSAGLASEPRISRLAGALGRELVTVRTNFFTWRRSLRLSGALMNGSGLVASAHLLGLARMSIGATDSWARLTPWGSHPLLDPQWSNDRTEICHWGSHRTRAEKFVRVAERPELLNDLWICDERASGNCGRCLNCARSRLALHLAGVSMPVEADAERLDPITAYGRAARSRSEATFMRELLDLAVRTSHHGAERMLRRGIARLERRSLLGELGDALAPRFSARRRAAAELMPWGPRPRPVPTR